MTKSTRKGPIILRLLVLGFSVVFGLLFFWLLGFVMDDIGAWPGPDLSELEDRLLDKSLRQTAESLADAMTWSEQHPEQVNSDLARSNALRYQARRFEAQLLNYLQQANSQFNPGPTVETVAA